MTEEYSWTFVQGSTNIVALSFEPKDPLADFGTLRIRFTSGAEYSYDKVPNQLAVEFAESESKGGFFHVNIRPKFDGVKLEKVEDAEELDDAIARVQGEMTPVQVDARFAKADKLFEGVKYEPDLPKPHRERSW